MRILTIAKDFPAPGHPGDGIFVLRQAQALAELGHEIMVVRVVPHAPGWTPKWRAYRAVPKLDVVEGIPVESVRAIFPPRMIGLEYLALQVDGAFNRIVERFAPDLVHAHFLLPSGHLAVRRGLPCVVTAHGSDAYDWAWRRPGLRRAAAEAVSRAGVVVAVSDFIRRQVRALVPRDVGVIFNGADDRLFGTIGKSEARARLGIEPDRFTIAFVGRPTHAKGVFDLLEAVAQLHGLRPLVLVAGAGPGAHPLASAVAARGVDARLCGTLAHTELAAVYAAADVFALPSYNEGLPVSVCEAMLSGVPVVATPVGGIPEIVFDGVHGYLVAPGDTAGLAARLHAIAHNPSHAARMGHTARAFAREHLTWRVNALRYERVYRTICDAAA